MPYIRGMTDVASIIAACLAVLTLGLSAATAGEPFVRHGGTSYPGAITRPSTTEPPLPYGPGFGTGVVVEPGAVTNRPAHLRTYRSYFEVPRTTVTQPRREGRIPLQTSSEHLQWCADRYRSYNAADNSWKPHGQPRRQCISPYR